MKKLKVEYDKNKCIGAGNCASIAPDYYNLSDGKATLKNSKDVGEDIYTIQGNYEDNTTTSLIDAGKECPVNAIKITDLEKNEDIVSVEVKEEDIKEVKAQYDDVIEFVLDKNGHFLIRLDRKNENIEVAFCNEKNKIVLKVIGKKPIDMYQTILNKGLSRK